MVVVTFVGGIWLSRVPVEISRALTALLGTVLVVSAANVLNMYLERDSDGFMTRTSLRPLPQKRMAPLAALAFGVFLGCLATPLMLLSGGPLLAGLGLLAFYLYVCIYTPMKRRSWFALYVGAVPGAMPPLMGWAFARGRIDLAGVVLFLVMFCWQIPHFLAIAVYRSQDYRKAGIRVLPNERGVVESQLHAAVFALFTLIATVALVPLGVAGWIFLATAISLGVPYLGFAVAGFFRRRSPDALRLWARTLFVFSLIHLTTLFLALAIDRRVL